MLIAQERELDRKRTQDWLDSRAAYVAGELERRLVDIVDRLPDPSENPPPVPAGVGDVVSLSSTSHGIQARPAGRLPYYPAPPVAEQRPPEGLFDAGEVLERRDHAYARAIATFRSLLTRKNPVVQAHALIRIARNHVELRQFDQALAAYHALERLGPIPIDGMPADLMALMFRGELLERIGRGDELERVARQVTGEMDRGRWALDRETYLTWSEEARQLFPRVYGASVPSPERFALAAALDRLWRDWQERPADHQSSGWRSLRVSASPPTLAHTESDGKAPEEHSVLLLWRTTAAGVTAMAAGPQFIESEWGRVWTGQGVRALLVDADKRPVLGDAVPAGAPTSVRSASDTRLPWTLTVTNDGTGAYESSGGARRAWLLPAALATMLLITLAGAFFTVRALAHEFALARQQSDFVAAVSHEFRTPLTSLRHLTELLATGVVSSEERRRQYYEVMTRETARLHRMVEGLLAFGRMEALGQRATFEPVDPVELTEQTVADFQAGADVAGHEVSIVDRMASHTSIVRANREALSRAVRNLLENAVKYSPNAPRIEVGVAREGRHVAIHVRDQGVGIPRQEQQKVFEKFARGAASQTLNVPGSGIGLAMARQIVDAHDGEVLLESSPGRGTTVTIRLPVIDAGKTA
jgi:signal transduction histidine kinase